MPTSICAAALVGIFFRSRAQLLLLLLLLHAPFLLLSLFSLFCTGSLSLALGATEKHKSAHTKQDRTGSPLSIVFFLAKQRLF